MNEEIIEHKQKQLSKPIKIILIIIFFVIAVICIFTSAIYLFIQPEILSGMLFGLALLFFVIVPLILSIIYYNKILNKKEKEEEKKIIELSKSKPEQKNRISLIE